MYTPSSYPRQDWVKHASKYFWTKQSLQSQDKKVTIMNNLKKKYYAERRQSPNGGMNGSVIDYGSQNQQYFTPHNNNFVMTPIDQINSNMSLSNIQTVTNRNMNTRMNLHENELSHAYSVEGQKTFDPNEHVLNIKSDRYLTIDET